MNKKTGIFNNDLKIAIGNFNYIIMKTSAMIMYTYTCEQMTKKEDFLLTL